MSDLPITIRVLSDRLDDRRVNYAVSLGAGDPVKVIDGSRFLVTYTSYKNLYVAEFLLEEATMAVGCPCCGAEWWRKDEATDSIAHVRTCDLLAIRKIVEAQDDAWDKVGQV